MLYNTDLISLETAARDYIGEESARLWTQARVFRAINAVYSKLVRKCLEADQAYFLTTKTYTLTGNSVTLPFNCWKPRAVLVYRDSQWYPIWWTGASDLYQFQTQTNDTQYARAVRFEGNKLYLEPGYANVSQLKLWYSRTPAPLIYGAGLAQIAGTTTINLGEDALNVADIYNGDYLKITAGVSAEDHRIISDYVASGAQNTWYATVTEDFLTNPDATSYVSLMLADPINKFPNLVALGAAMFLLTRRRDQELFQTLAALYGADVEEFDASVGQRQTDQPRYVNYIPRGDE